MKKSILILVQVFVLLSTGSLKSQSVTVLNQITPNGMFDIVYDRFGNTYDLADLRIGAGRYSVNTVNSVSNTCIAGYFKLYFEAGSYLDQNLNARSVACQVFSDLSALINSTLSALSNTTYVNIYCNNGAGLGTGTPYYILPAFPTNPNQGIIDNQVWKTIITGFDAYSNLPVAPFIFNTGTNNFYHGALTINPSPAPTNSTWNLSLTTSTSTTTEYDLYSVILHEATHILGFLSLMNQFGNSQFNGSASSQLNNYFSRYDSFLYDHVGNPLLSSSTPSCNTSNLSFFPSSATVLAQTSAPNCTVDITNCGTAVQYSSASTTATVYTPSCWEPGSSLSHFEDMCTHPNGTTVCTGTVGNWNNYYFNMVNANGMGSCYIKRYLKDEERFVLCDLGYSVNAVNTSTVSGANYSYSAGACSGTDVWGVNDGFNGGVYTFSTTGTSLAIPISSSITINDSPNTSTISCLEVVYNNATVSTSGSSLIVNSIQNIGLVLIKYIPKNSSGEFGNATYIYVYFFPGSCNAGNDCNLVQNGGFENLAPGTASCGSYIGSNYPFIGVSNLSLLDCWQNYENSPDLFTRGCTLGIGDHNLGTNTFGTTLDSYSGPGNGNDRIVGIASFSDTPNNFNEILKNNLSSALTPSNVYEVSFLVCNYTGSISAANANPSAAPVVVTLASEDNFLSQGSGTGNYPFGLNILTEFTVNAATNPLLPWTLVTHTFVFNHSVPHNVLLIGVDVAKTASQAGAGGYYYVFLDEVKLYQYPTSATFSIPTASSCGNTTYTNLIQYASTTGTFSGQGVTLNSGQYDFNLSGSLPVGTYPVAFTYSTTCLTTIWQNIVVSPQYTLSPLVNTTLNCVNLASGVVLYGVIAPANNNLNYIWQPGNLTGSITTANPISTTVYTVTATDINNCSGTTTLAVNVPTNCCSSPSIPNFSATSVTSNTFFTGPMTISSDFTVHSGTTAFLGGEFVFTDNAKITVANGAVLDIRGSHFYACGANMWKGIVVQSGGLVLTSSANGLDCLIEDAETAIDISNYAVNTSTHIANIENTTFNKNYIDINLSNYVIASNTYNTPIKLKNCVFTCRDFTFSPTSWPSASISDLRSVGNPTTGLDSPYLLQNAPIINLKAPYSSNHSHTAINIINAGTTYTGAAYTYTYYALNIGSVPGASPTANFVLFDAHENFISGSNSNIKILNCVFQNTQSFYQNSVLTTSAAVEFMNGSGVNSVLDLSSTSVDVGNRFWNCHSGVHANNPTSFVVENALFRSIQSNTLLSSSTFSSVGAKAIDVNVDFMPYCYIHSNEFTNIKDGILMSSPGSFRILDLSILSNTFSPYLNTAYTGSGSNYVQNAISLVSPLQDVNVYANGSGVLIDDNLLYRVYNGINLNGISVHLSHYMRTKMISNNNIVLEEDILSNAQFGIDNSNAQGIYSTNNSAPYVHSIEQNNISLFGNNTNNINVSLFHGFNNFSGTTKSSHVICNTLTAAYQGFVFEGPNWDVVWKGNEMDVQQRGLTLMNAGQMSQQGASGAPTDNKWLNTWSGSNYGTFVDVASSALSSKLYVKTGSPWFPQNSFGTAANNLWYNWPGNSPTTTGTYTCGGSYNQFIPPAPIAEDYDSESLLYISNMAYYEIAYFNDSLRDAEPELEGFYTLHGGSSFEKFTQIKDEILQENPSAAASILAALVADIDFEDLNTVETNYVTFYQLYLKCLDPDVNGLSEAEMAALTYLAGLCPGTNGSPVYQARALYQFITGLAYNGPDGCQSYGERRAHAEPKQATANNAWNINLYPNPNTGSFTLVSKKEAENLRLSIRDVSNRVLFNQVVRTEKHTVTLDLQLLNGIYFVTLRNEANESITKKMVVAK